MLGLPYNNRYRAIGYDAKRGNGISVVDPGAVPGGSTTSTNIVFVFLWGRNRIDTRNKGYLRRSGRYPRTQDHLNIDANDNFAPMTAANDNGMISAVAA